MKCKKLKKIVASAIVLASFVTNSIVSAATTTSTSTATGTSATISTSSTSANNENVLKVNVYNDGTVSYTEPVAATTDSTTVDPQDKPFSWSNATVYFVLTDRFKNGDTTNDHSYGRGLQKDGVTPQVGLEGSKNIENPGTFHGGDLKGLTQKLNDGYFTKLGINAIWISSPLEQQHGFTSGNKKGDQGQYGEGGGFPYYAYHGYWTFDPTNIDANMGTKQDFATFVDTAHKLGIRVVMDVVLNHTGYVTMYDVNEYGAGSLKTGWEAYYFGDVTKLSGGLPENQTWYNFDSPLWANWFGADYVRMSSPLLGYDYVPNGCSETAPLCGLPDVKTESTKEIAIPPILVTKWTREGRLAQEKASLDTFFTKQNLPRTARNYEIKWLTDWVRNYGVDGFRCDTAKHVEIAAWKSLQQQADIALKEWRANNPTKAGAKWTDKFWMTGECWGYGTGRSAYYDNGFASMINFSFPKDGSTTSLEGTYSSYASQFNSATSDYNALSYISSHDTSLGARGNLIGGGTSLLLAPGGAQIFYGDETGRQFKWKDWFTSDYTDQCTRSDMNWDSIDTATLTHWQILGQFRNNHLAVGAGVHKQLSASPYTFSRIYAKNGVTDRVVCAVNVVGPTAISVEGVFGDNAKVRDFYTGTMYTVSNGKVNVTPGSTGVVLLEKGDNSPDVGVSQISTKYYTDSIDVTLYVSKGATATYSINGGTAKAYTDGQTVTIGAGVAIGDQTTLSISATNSDGSVGPCNYTYTKGDPKETLKVHAKYTQFTTTAPNVYLYSGDGAAATQYDGKWPGTAMTSEGNGWYVFNCTSTRTAKAIFNGSFGQTPGSQQPGIDVAGEVWILNGTVTTYNPENPTKTGTVNVKYVDESGNTIAPATTKTGNVGTTYTTTAATVDGYTLKTTPANASGTFTESTITVTYVYAAASKGTVNVKYVDENGATVAPTVTKTGAVGAAYTTTSSTVSGYTLKTTPSNASGKFTTSTITVTYVYTKNVPLAITSYKASVPSPQVVGTSIKLTTTATGTGTLNYKYIVTKAGQTVFTRNYSATNSTTWTPTEAGTYTIYFRAKDSTGIEISKSLTYVINPKSTLSINSITPSVTTQTVGKSVTFSVNATNAVSYSFWINDVNGDWKQISGYSANKSVAWTPKAAGTYVIWVDAKDSNGKIVNKYISYTVTAN